MPDGEKLTDKGGRTWHSAVVTAELDEEENQETGQGADRRYVEKVVDVAIPGSKRISVVAGGRRRREGIFHRGKPVARGVRKLGFYRIGIYQVFLMRIEAN